jgi:hypothetical protein
MLAGVLLFEYGMRCTALFIIDISPGKAINRVLQGLAVDFLEKRLLFFHLLHHHLQVNAAHPHLIGRFQGLLNLQTTVIYQPHTTEVLG